MVSRICMLLRVVGLRRMSRTGERLRCGDSVFERGNRKVENGLCVSGISTTPGMKRNGNRLMRVDSADRTQDRSVLSISFESRVQPILIILRGHTGKFNISRVFLCGTKSDGQVTGQGLSTSLCRLLPAERLSTTAIDVRQVRAGSVRSASVSVLLGPVETRAWLCSFFLH